MKIRIDSMMYRDHPAVRDGIGGLCAMPTARLYNFPAGQEGVWGNADAPAIQARRVTAWWQSHPSDGRWVYPKGYGDFLQPNADQMLLDYERGEIDITRGNDLRFIEQFMAALETPPEMVHLDCEEYYGYWQFGGVERQRAFRLIGESKRALKRMTPATVQAFRTGHWDRQAIIDFNRHGAMLCGQAIRRMFDLAGYSGPIAAFGYWNSPDVVLDGNGWPINAPTPDLETNCYGAYDDNEPGAIGRQVEPVTRDRFPSHVVTGFAAKLGVGSDTPANNVVVYRAFDPVQGIADRIAVNMAQGCTDAILWADTDPSSKPLIDKTLTDLASLLGA